MSLDSLQSLFLEELKDILSRREATASGPAADGEGRGVS
jgi:hypothetical protein